MNPYSSQNLATAPVSQTAHTLRRLLHYLQMASYELDGLVHDDRIKQGARSKFKRYREKYTEWVRRDILTDMKDYRAAGEVVDELTSERALDLQLHLDFLLQFNNISEITEALKESFEEQKKH